MSIIAEFTVTSTEFPLGVIFKNNPEATIELERIIPTKPKLIPYFWVQGPGSEEILAAFRDNPVVRNIRVVDEVDGKRLVRVEWEHDANGILHAVRETDVTLISAEGTKDGWTLETRADDSDVIRKFQEQCREYGIPVELRALHALTPLRDEARYRLTESQREALVLAYDRGYFDSPRQTTLEELGSEVGITGQSFGSRLRGGTKRLIGSTLTNAERPE
ncbi:bacterio-opsin activator domain-containing protein [Halovenus marina]|uniref:helix-turn-helix domain-containing protein n=1 Tax=Halovenus marina TaxID=3396621 RepID=UPI003F543620